MRVKVNVHGNLYCIKYTDLEYWPNVDEDEYDYGVMEKRSDARLYELMAILTLTGDYHDVRRLIEIEESKGL